jgi:hypothetical protein
MTSPRVADPRKGQEDAFFAEQDAILLRRMRQKDERASMREALAAASGLQDDDTLHVLLDAGVEPQTLGAFALLPVAVVAWADGHLAHEERMAALAAAERCGLARGEAGWRLLQRWLVREPSPALVAAWKAYMQAQAQRLDEAAWQTRKQDVLSSARAVAKAVGGFLGVGSGISDTERSVLRRVEDALAD